MHGNYKRVRKWLKRNATKVTDYHTSVYCMYLGHRVRMTFDQIDIGDEDFDRWANSKAYSFTIDGNGDIAQQMNLAIEIARRNSRPLYDRVYEKMVQLSQVLVKDPSYTCRNCVLTSIWKIGVRNERQFRKVDRR